MPRLRLREWIITVFLRAILVFVYCRYVTHLSCFFNYTKWQFCNNAVISNLKCNNNLEIYSRRVWAHLSVRNCARARSLKYTRTHVHTYLRSPMARARLQKHVHPTIAVRTNSARSCISRVRANGCIRPALANHCVYQCESVTLPVFIVCFATLYPNVSRRVNTSPPRVRF